MFEDTAAGSCWHHSAWWSFVVLALVVAFLLLPACGLRPLAGWLETCPPAPVAVLVALEEEAERTAALARPHRATRTRDRRPAGLSSVSTAGASARAGIQGPIAGNRKPATPTRGTATRVRRTATRTRGSARGTRRRSSSFRGAIEEAPPLPEESEEQSEFGERLDAEDGEVSEVLTVTLIWDDRSDLDLEVHCPGGGTAGVRGTAAVEASSMSMRTATVPMD